MPVGAVKAAPATLVTVAVRTVESVAPMLAGSAVTAVVVAVELFPGGAETLFPQPAKISVKRMSRDNSAGWMRDRTGEKRAQGAEGMTMADTAAHHRVG